MDQQQILTPADVREVIFDKAPLGKRGYDEKQVDAFLDRVEATLIGTDQLTADDVRSVVFEDAPLIKRGYHEDQVDNFLDAIVGTFELRERKPPKLPPPPPRRRPAPIERTDPMVFAQPPSLPVFDPTPVTQPLKPYDGDIPPPQLKLPIPPAPPGARGYRPSDVEKLAILVAAAGQLDGPTSADLEAVTLGKTIFDGQGYRAEVVDLLRAAWIEELRYREGRPRA